MALSKGDTTLLLIAVDAAGKIAGGLGGITRLQKYLFLLGKEPDLGRINGEYDFQAFKYGPFSPKLFDELEFLENIGYIKSEITAEATEEEITEIEEMSFDDLMGDGSEDSSEGRFDGFGSTDAWEEKRYLLTEKGRERVEGLLADNDNTCEIDAIRRIKSRFAHYSLLDLLYYVYTKYPEMTVGSEIKEKVLKRGLKR